MMICNSIDILKKYIPTIVNNDFEKYRAEVTEANTWFKKEIAGANLYNTIIGALDAEETPQGHLKIIELSEAVVSRKAYLAGIPSYDLTETAGGFVVTRNENQAPASPERVKKLEDAISLRLTDAIEDLLEFLEETAAYHEDWKGSPTYTLLTDIYIKTLRDFRRYATFDGSRLDWIAAKPRMFNTIRLSIWPVISQELSDQIIEQLRDEDLSEKNKTIIEDLRFAFANFFANNPEAGNSYLMRIRKRLLANPADFPAFDNSELYTAIKALAINKYNPERGIFRAGF
jgi:hypothetical protein